MGNKRHYADFFSVPQDYKANETRDSVNDAPDTWMKFYPHTKYVEFLSTLLEVINGSDKTIWLTGNYGTGKTIAVLVTQKLFMDEESRVKQWFVDRKNALEDGETIQNNLFACRNEGTLVVYDYNADGLDANEGFLVRLERGVVSALNENGMLVPAKANLDEITDRLHREGENFFKTRDKIRDKLAYLHSGIKAIDQLINELNRPHNAGDSPTDLLGDIQKVFHEDGIFLGLSTARFSEWIDAVIAANNLKRVVYIFDEFSAFIDNNKGSLKTFESVAEMAGKFYLIPVTHLEINAYLSESAKNPKKSGDRFYFRNLQMPNDVAFRLAGDAIKRGIVSENAFEWETEKGQLWSAVSSIADVNFNANDVSRQSFYDILPIHPMAAFLLKFLSTSAGSNQRSIFEYLKGSANGREFQDFCREGGPSVEGKQYLTADYLWKYFVERDDLGVNKEITSIRSEFERIKNREFQNRMDDDEDIRILKAILLFCLLGRLNPDGHERLRPTVENVELSFRGDGAIVGVANIVKSLADKHCFSVVNGNIELFTTSVGGAELQTEIAKWENKFHDLLSDKTKDELEKHTKQYRQYHSAGRFEIKVSDVNHTSLSNLSTATRDRFGEGINKDDGSVLLWFVFAKDKNEQAQIPDKIKSLLGQLRGHRILCFTFPNLTFCEKNVELWQEYVRQYAQYMLENDSTAKGQRKSALEKMEGAWFGDIKQAQVIKVYTANEDGSVSITDTSWTNFKILISEYVRKSLPCCMDYLTSQITAFGKSGLKSWALAGIQFDAASGQYKQLVNVFKNQGISTDGGWFAQNTDHPLTKVHELFEKKIANTIGRGTNLSLRKVYIELQRAPYGMKYNVLSAFTLGFLLKDVLVKGYQWTNEQITKSLDADTLAEIIESVVKDDGNDRIRGEKLICRLSKEEKAFMENAPKMFGVTNAIPDGTVESVLLSIQTNIEKTSGRVPLWVLPEYVHSVSEPKAELISTVLEKLCVAGSISSKGKVEERSNAVKGIGTLILATSGLVDTISGYIKPENFVSAFRIYVDKTAPELRTLAENVGDVSGGYCGAVKEKIGETAGWLWTQTDIGNEINRTICEYEVIKMLKPLLGFTDFTPYKSVTDSLRTVITTTNKLPKALIISAYPALTDLLNEIGGNISGEVIKAVVSQNKEAIKKLFFDGSRTLPVQLLKTRLSDVTSVTDNELLTIYNGLQSGFYTSETTFLNEVRVKVEDYAKNSIGKQIVVEWKRISSTETPSRWAVDNRIPARLLFGDNLEWRDLLGAIETPGNYSSDKLKDLLEALKGIKPPNIGECQKRFIAETVPQRYTKFNINLSSLLDFLRSKYGIQPNNWVVKPDVHEFLEHHYKGEFAPQITDKLKKTSADDLKKKLIQLANENPDLGLLFWE